MANATPAITLTKANKYTTEKVKTTKTNVRGDKVVISSYNTVRKEAPKAEAPKAEAKKGK